MIPSIRITYLACSKSGMIVSTFECPNRAREHVASRPWLELAVQTITIKPLVMVAEDAPVVKLRGRA